MNIFFADPEIGWRIFLFLFSFPFRGPIEELPFYFDYLLSI